MLRNNNYYKSSDLLDDSYKNRMNSYFNPYEYNLDSNLKNEINMDVKLSKSNRHNDRKIIKK